MNTNLLVRKTVLNRFKNYLRSVKAQKRSDSTELAFTAYMSAMGFLGGLELMLIATEGTFTFAEVGRMKRIAEVAYYS